MIDATVQKYRNAIELALKEQKEVSDIFLDHSQVSFAFPGGRPSPSSGYEYIDWDVLVPWAKNLGWHAQSAPEATHPEQQHIPKVRFTRLTHK